MLVTRGTRDYEDPGTPESPASTAGDTHQTQILLFLHAVPQPRLAGERGDRGVRDPGPSHSGHAPHADHNLHLGDSLPPPEADRGLQGPLDNVDGGEDRGRAPNADILVSELSKTLQKLDSSIIGRSPVTAERQTGNSIRRPQYCPSWLEMNYSTAEVFDIESKPSDSDRLNIVYSFNCYCWQGCGGLRSA